MSDTELLDYLESLFTGKFRNSLFIAHDLPTFAGTRQMINMDIRNQSGVVHRAKTVRGAIKLAMEYERDNQPNS